jgi:hypothetical protein
MVIFHSYVKLPEGNLAVDQKNQTQTGDFGYVQSMFFLFFGNDQV